MSTAPIWRGSLDLTHTPESFAYDDNDSGNTLTLIYSGPYATAKAARPARYALVAELEGTDEESWVVISTSLRRLPGEQGLLTLTLTAPENADGSGGEEDPATNETEIDQSQLELPIETFSEFHSGSTAYSTYHLDAEITLYTLDDAGIPTTTASTDPRDVNVPLGLVWEVLKTLPLQDRRTLYLRIPEDARPIIDELTELTYSGHTSYLVFPPVVRIRRRSQTIPAESTLGKVYTTIPHATSAPTGWDYLKSGQRALKSGLTSPYDLELIYTGARAWLERFYPEA